MLLQDYLSAAAARLGEKVALVCGRERVSYAELEMRSNALAHGLAQRGVGRGDRVIIFADNGVEAVVAFWAILKADGVVSIVNPLTRADKLGYLLNDCRASALVTSASLAPVFNDAVSKSAHVKAVIVAGVVSDGALVALPGGARWSDLLSEFEPFGGRAPARRCLDIDLAAIVYTSGSTGQPKGVMLTQSNMLAAASSVSSYLGLREDDVVLSTLPLSFDYGLYQMIMAFRSGARIVLDRFPVALQGVLQREGVTVFPGVPTMFASMLELRLRPADFAGVRIVTNTAAALSTRHIVRMRELFDNARIFSMYGLTECKRCTYLPPEDLARKPTSVGIAIPNTELWLVDENDRRLPRGEVGQLVIRGATVMRGYWEKPEASARKLRPGPLPGEYVLYTGDLCRMDDEGYLYFVGRMDDIIKSRGEKVAPKEVEGAIGDIPGVKEVAVVGVPDDILGQAIKAVVVLEQGAAISASDIQRECHARLESFMVPQHVTFVPELPKTSSGKIQKTGLG
jgi:amino acid adenylation domain-containing protein